MKKRKKIPNMQRRQKGQAPIPQENVPESSGRDINDAQIAEFMEKAEAALASSGSQTRYFVHDPMGLHSQQEPDGTWRHMIRDGLNSIRGVTDDALSILESRGYDPLGNPSEVQGTSQTPFGFTGEMTDSNGLIHLRARDYNPALGVFVSPDPLPGEIQNPVSLNSYVYALDNPTNYTDPSGMSVEQPGSPNLGLSILRGGFKQIRQYPCLSSAHSSPFGCDELGRPIPYTVIRGFAQGGYGATGNCPGWNFAGSVYASHHCGIDMVSFSDPGWLWYLEIEDPPVLIMDEVPAGVGVSSPAYFNAYTGKYAPYGTPVEASDQWKGPLTQTQFQQARFRYRGHNYESSPVEGRAVYAIRSGFVTEYDPGSATLKVVEPPDYPGEPRQLMIDRLEIQYTHILPLESVLDKYRSGKKPYVRAGQHIGYYAYVGSTDEPHLHVLFKQINIPPDYGCPPEDIYLNPVNPRGRFSTNIQFDLAAMWTPSGRRPGGYPDHIAGKGSRAQNGQMGMEHPLYEPPAEIP